MIRPLFCMLKKSPNDLAKYFKTCNCLHCCIFIHQLKFAFLNLISSYQIVSDIMSETLCVYFFIFKLLWMLVIPSLILKLRLCEQLIARNAFYSIRTSSVWLAIAKNISSVQKMDFSSLRAYVERLFNVFLDLGRNWEKSNQKNYHPLQKVRSLKAAILLTIVVTTFLPVS